ncbi:MAG: undecaprenyl-diphosphate phosphatase [Tannerella sp.]|jgi:undecaprenyl-diphosphatase|nr:undecaprenyl-diphosphate phosphatase [Tannerella sp.]
MNSLEAIILGIIQGLTEFLPVSSSGHLAIVGTLFGLNGSENLAFAVIVHVATVFSTLFVLRKEIAELFGGLFAFKWNDQTKTVAKLLLSMLPVAVVGLFLKDKVEEVFGSGLLIVGCMLIITALLLLFAIWARGVIVGAGKDGISYRDAFIIGIAQAIAVMPGLSRSGSTIATGIMLGNNSEKVAKFSFLMVIIPVMGEALLDGVKLLSSDVVKSESAFGAIPAGAAIFGFAAAFITGLLACKWMLNIVKSGKLLYFVYYCTAIGVFAILYSQLVS